MSDQDENAADKEHEPTEKKLADARRKGEIPRSPDLTTAASFAGLTLAAIGFGAESLQNIGSILAGLLAQSDRLAPEILNGAKSLSAGPLQSVLGALMPLFLLPMICALLAVFAQRTMLFTPSKLAPKANRISPISGFKNKFGRNGLFEFVKSASKLVLVSVAMGWFVSTHAAEMIGLVYLNPALASSVMGRHIIEFLILVLAISTAIGGVDFFWQKAEHQRSNRMSRKDLQDEQKDSEGDPHIKANRRQKAQQIATNQMLSEVPKADVIIVNPTHYAVALKWDRGTGRAPTCVAKGVDEIAARIRDCAIEAGVPLHSDPPTARLLYANLKIGQEVSPDHYRAVAAAIRFAERMKKKAGAYGKGTR